jgi:hypothetical protein
VFEHGEKDFAAKIKEKREKNQSKRGGDMSRFSVIINFMDNY